MATVVDVTLLSCFLSLAYVCGLPQIQNITPLPPFQRTPFPPPPGAFIPIVQQNFDIAPDASSYAFGYQSADGSSRQETGSLKYPFVPGTDNALLAQGSYSYVAPDGQQVEVQYIADENGFQPSGPGIHPAILKAVALQVAEAKGQQPPVPVPPPNVPIPRPFPFPAPFSAPIPFTTPLPFRPARR